MKQLLLSNVLHSKRLRCQLYCKSYRVTIYLHVFESNMNHKTYFCCWCEFATRALLILDLYSNELIKSINKDINFHYPYEYLTKL